MSTARFQGENTNKLLIPLFLIALLAGGFIAWRYIDTQGKNKDNTAQVSSSSSTLSSSASSAQPLYSLSEVFSQTPASLNNKFVDLANVRVADIVSDNSYLLSGGSNADTRVILVKYSPLLLPTQSKLVVGESHNVYGQLVSMPTRDQLKNVWGLQDQDIEKVAHTVYYIEAIGISRPSGQTSSSTATPGQ